MVARINDVEARLVEKSSETSDKARLIQGHNEKRSANWGSHRRGLLVEHARKCEEKMHLVWREKGDPPSNWLVGSVNAWRYKARRLRP